MEDIIRKDLSSWMNEWINEWMKDMIRIVLSSLLCNMTLDGIIIIALNWHIQTAIFPNIGTL